MPLQIDTKRTTTGGTTNDALKEEEQFDIVAKRQELEQTLVNSKEVDDLTSTISVSDTNTIVNFGGQVAEEISHCSDDILRNMNMQQVNDSGQLLSTLKNIMDKFDPQELEQTGNKSFIGKIFSNAKKQLEAMLSKYHTMGEEVDKIYVQLKEYESEIGQSNTKLDKMFDANIGYYQQLVKYILAGEQGCRELDEYLDNLKKDYEQTNDNMTQLEITDIEQAKNMLEQRVQDLRIAENVAMQSLPMIKAMKYSNLNLMRKINSAFIITLPVFKQALTQVILLKRQKIQADSMQALDEKTNELLIRNAENTVAQTKLTAQLASGSSIKVETLEKTWQTICTGIDETRRIQDEANAKREADKIRLQQLNDSYRDKMGVK